jgi:hypothetical protein
MSSTIQRILPAMPLRMETERQNHRPDAGNRGKRQALKDAE